MSASIIREFAEYYLRKPRTSCIEVQDEASEIRARDALRVKHNCKVESKYSYLWMIYK